MKEILHQMLLGMGAILLGPSNAMPEPSTRITLPPESATQAIAFDFSSISKDLMKAIDKIENRKQLELELRS